ncbi:MAG: GH25 family lysozyme [Bacillota bacterium]|nr:GH25 family lysozyme [Bacillota bacterium]
MGYIVDISKFQPCNKIDWPTFSKNVDLLIARVQYGSTVPDEEYQGHANCAKQHGVPFLTYAFPCFVSVPDARVEARDAATRQDKDSKGMIIDIEAEFDKLGNPVGITKLSTQERLDGLKAFVDELRKQGVNKVGAYVAHNIYRPWGFDTIANLFDFVWIPRYGVNDGQQHTKPDYPCDLWQYTSVGKVPGYNGPLDLSVLTGSKPLEWFTGAAQAQPASIGWIPTSNPICAQVRVIASALNIRQGPGTQYPIVQVAKKGKIFNVTANINDWHEVILDNNGSKGYAYGNKGTYLELIR